MRQCRWIPLSTSAGQPRDRAMRKSPDRVPMHTASLAGESKNAEDDSSPKYAALRRPAVR